MYGSKKKKLVTWLFRTHIELHLDKRILNFAFKVGTHESPRWNAKFSFDLVILGIFSGNKYRLSVPHNAFFSLKDLNRFQLK